MGVYRGITQDNVTLNGGTAYNLNLVTPSIDGTALSAKRNTAPEPTAAGSVAVTPAARSKTMILPS